MSAPDVICLCGEPLRPQSNFCRRCGRELRQNCPVCFDEPRRLIAKRDPDASPWCDNRGNLLIACEGCGRWFSADVQKCPDPDCRGNVRPTWPAETGRVIDGTGCAEAWRWPAVWDRLNPHYVSPQYNAWNSDAPIHAAFVAHGRLYVWAGTTLVAPPGAAGGPLSEVSNQGSIKQWNCWLSFDGQPDPFLLKFNRVALIGGGVILAARNNFLLVGLCTHRTDDFISLNIGMPLAQAASEGWWVAWSQESGRSILWTAPTAADWRKLEHQQVADAPPESVPRKNTPLVMKEGIAYWIGEKDELWQLDCRSQKLQRLTGTLSGAQRVWHANDGLHIIRATGDGLLVGLNAVGYDKAVREAHGGAGPLRDMFVSSALTAVVGENVTPLNTHTGDIIGGAKYSGRWVAGALVEAQPDAADQEPRLLMLTQDMDEGSLTALRPSSGGEEAVWRETGVRPINLIVAGESLYVVNERGVTRIQEGLP